MNEQKIETFWRDATAEDVARVMNGEKVEARFRDYDHADWTEFDLLGGFATSVNYPVSWFDVCGVRWFQCQVYDPPQWYIDKPDPGEGWRLLKKFPAEKVKDGDEYESGGSWFPSTRAAYKDIDQDTTLWYRRRIEPIEVTTSNCVAYETQAGEVIRLPNGKRFKVTQEGFEVL